jgi:hypothetical protein
MAGLGSRKRRGGELEAKFQGEEWERNFLFFIWYRLFDDGDVWKRSTSRIGLKA